MANPADAIYQLMSTDGHGGGLTSLVQTSGKTFKITAPQNTEYILVRMNVYLEDDGQFRGDRYGSSSALSNGIVIRVLDTDGSTLLDFTNGWAIKKIGHWSLLAGVDVAGTNYTTGNNTWLVRWTMAKAGKEIILKPGQSMALITQDNMGAGGAALIEHFAQMQGYKNSLLS